MAFKFWVRRLTSVLLGLASVHLASAEAFGRFGYVDSWAIPGVVLTKEGIKTEHPAADMLRFTLPLKAWKPIATSDLSQTVSTGDFAGNPAKCRQDLTSPGFSAYFPKGLRFTLRCTTGPILTWATDGSMEANTGYATPPSMWVVVSFRDAQPPILMSFKKPTGIRLTGRSGEWVMATDGDYEGWVRFSAPLGSRPLATNSPADLAKLTSACAAGIEIATQDSPVLVSKSATDEGPMVLGEWTYDRPGAIVPYAAFASPFGGYAVQIVSKIKRLDIPTSLGPTFVTDEPKLAMRFVVRRVPTGRALLLGAPNQDGIGTASYLDHITVSELALANLVSTLEKGSRDLASSTVAEFLSEATYHVEPNTGQRLPYDGPGNGLDLSAAHALLMQSTLTTARPTSEPNSMLTSLMWRRDWLTWQLTCPDAAKRRRAQALTALAAAISPEPERRLDAAMLQAGLAAERGLAIWKQRALGTPPPGKLIETFDGVREDIFGKEDYRRKTGYGRVILSEIRAFGDVGVSLVEVDKKRLLRWTAEDSRPMTITLAAAFPFDVEPGKNVADSQISQGLGFTIIRVRPKNAGVCEAELSMPDWIERIPAWIPAPRYEEIER